MIRSILTGFMLLVFLFSGMAQEAVITDEEEKSYTHWMQFTYYNGMVFPTDEFLEGDYEGGQAVDRFRAFSIDVGWQRKKGGIYSAIYGNPAWGLGVYHAGFGRPDDLGAPWAFYGLYSGPFVHQNRFSILYDIQLGMSFNWIPFDEETNPYQITLGDDKAAFVKIGIRFQYQISRYFNLDGGIALSHFSNGATVFPNNGINMAALHLGLRYYLEGIRPQKRTGPIPAFQKRWNWTFAPVFGQKQVAYDTTNSFHELDRRYITETYTVYGLSTGIFYQFAYKSSVGLGLDLMYDESLTAVHNKDDNTIQQTSDRLADRATLGIYASYELVANNLSFLLQPGYYLYIHDPSESTPDFYQRVAIRYYFRPNLFAGVGVRAYRFSVADYIEWKIGYRLEWY